MGEIHRNRRRRCRSVGHHLSANLVSSVFERDAEVWLQLLRQIRRQILAEAVRRDISLIMMRV